MPKNTLSGKYQARGEEFAYVASRTPRSWDARVYGPSGELRGTPSKGIYSLLPKDSNLDTMLRDWVNACIDSRVTVT